MPANPPATLRFADDTEFWRATPIPGLKHPLEADTYNWNFDTRNYFQFDIPSQMQLKFAPSYIWRPILLCRKILGTISNRANYKDALMAEMRAVNIQGSIMVDCETRWGTVYLSVTRFLELVVPLWRFACSDVPSATMAESIKDTFKFIPVLSCIKRVWADSYAHQILLQDDKYPTAGLSLPFAYKQMSFLGSNFCGFRPPLAAILPVAPNLISRVLQKHHPELGPIINRIDIHIQDAMLKILKLGMNALIYFASMLQLFFRDQITAPNCCPAVLRYATILTPSHKHLEFLNDDERTMWYTNFDQTILAEERKMEARAGFVLAPSARYPDLRNALKYYLDQPLPAQGVETIDYWKTNDDAAMKILKQLFYEICCIPATCAPSERSFSLTGNTVVPNRPEMSATQLVKLTITQRNAGVMVRVGHPDPTRIPDLAD